MGMGKEAVFKETRDNLRDILLDFSDVCKIQGLDFELELVNLLIDTELDYWND